MILDVVNSSIYAISIGQILFFLNQNNYEQFENLWSLMTIALWNILYLFINLFSSLSYNLQSQYKAIISFQNILGIKNVTGKSRFQFLILFAVFVSVK